MLNKEIADKFEEIISGIYEEINDLFILNSQNKKVLTWEDWNKYLGGKDEGFN